MVVYSPHGKEILGLFKERFEREHPETRVDFLYLSSQQCLERVRNERESPGADVWWGAGHTTFMTAADEGVLESYQPSWKGAVSEDRHDPEHRWYACFLSPEIIFYNHDILSASEAPRDWEDLADPRFGGRLLLRFPVPSDTMRAIFFGRIFESLETTGSEDAAFEWMLGLDANTKHYLESGEQVFRKMAQRVGSVSVWTLSDIMLQKSRYHSPFEIVFPKSGCPVILDGIALVKNAPHPKAARAYYEFVTSSTSAALLANEPFCRIPTRQDVPPEELPDWMRQLEFETQPLDWSLYMRRMNEWMRKWSKQVKGQGKTRRGGRP